MDPSGTHADGAMQFGSQLVQINSVNYVFEKISVKKGQRRIQQNDIYGVPNKKVHVRTLTEGTATLQFPNATAPSPPTAAVSGALAQFALVPAGGGAAVNFLCEDASEEFDHEGETKCNISFSEKLN
jgi:hypothetical protein